MRPKNESMPRYEVSNSWVWVLTILLFVVSRLSILPIVLDFRADELLYQKWGLLINAGSFPVGYEQYQYPPGAGLLFAGIEAAPGSFHRIFMAGVLGSDVLIFALLLWRVGRKGDSWRGPWTWIVGGFLAGGLLYERFDLFPTLLAIAALLTLSRPFTSGLLMGIGSAVKIWPLFALFALRRGNLVKGISGAMVGVAAVLVAAYLVAQQPFSFLMGQSERGLQVESVLAGPILMAEQFGLTSASVVNRYGSSEVDAPFAGFMSWIGIAIAFLLISSIALMRLRGRLEVFPGTDVALAVILAFVAFNRVFSPEYFVWIAGIAAVTLLNHRSRMLVPVVLIFANMLPVTQYLGPYYWSLQALNIEAVGLQFLRASLTLASALLAIWILISGRARHSS